MTESPRMVLDHPSYPNNGTFADLLSWHLEVWGTRPTGPPAIWELRKFREAIFGALADDEERLVYGWLGSGSPPSPENLKQVIKVLFGDDPIFTEWRIDLTQACRDSRGKNGVKNKRTKVSLDQSRSMSTTANVGEAPQNSLNPLRTSQTNHLGADAKHGVKVVADTLAEHYYGRTADLEMVSAFVDARMAGSEAALLVVTAPAGFGKSALAVNWCNNMERHPNRRVAVHLCSTLTRRATTSLDNIFANLHRQIAEAYGTHPQSLKDNDAVTGLLATAPPGDKQLVLWLDGLDEADELVPCFLPQKLGDRVCVILSARAEGNVTPAYVDEWQNSLRAEPHRPQPHFLNKLSKEGVHELLAGLCRPERFTPSEGLAVRIYNASEQGYPLFARLMSEDALEAMRMGKEVDLGDAPVSLANYVARQLERLEQLAAWREYQPLFAFLTIAREAVRIDELPALIGQRLLPKIIPVQIARWFTLVADRHDRPPMLSIVHPKLTELFGRALGYQRGVAARDLCERMVGTDSAKWPLYAWRHLPRHLLEMGLIDEAVRHLTEIEFITARFAALGTDDCLTTMRADWIAWYGSEQRTKQKTTDTSHDPMRHLRFWNNYSAQLSRAAAEGFDKSWLQMMHDVGLVEVQADTILVSPNPQTLSDSQATLRGHEDSVNGALLLPDDTGFLSWSEDRTLRLWGAAGEEGAVLRGHEGSVDGALLLPDGAGFLSWGADRTLRLWGAAGEEGAVLRGHEGSVDGALLLPDGAGFLSWSRDQTLCLWSETGETSTVLSGHENWVNGALLLPDGAGFLSWSRDRTLRLWGAAGEERAVLRGHEFWVIGALLLPDDAGFLSWSGDRTLRLWGAAGEEGAVLRGHEYSVNGALLLPDDAGFLSWSEDGTLRLWGAAGEEHAVLRGHDYWVNGALLLPGGAGFLSWSWDQTLCLCSATGGISTVLSGHENWVNGALLLPDGAGFLSWSRDRTLRLWGAAGEERAVLRGHEDSVNGALLLPDDAGFLSWGADRTLRLWGAAGEERAVLRGHENWVNGALLLPDGAGFLSWSRDQTLCLWSETGKTSTVLIGHEDSVNGALLLPDDAGFLSWSEDRTLRLWGAAGEEGAVLRGHESSVNGALLLPDDAGFLSWGEDGTLRLWSAAGGERAVLRGHKHSANGALLLPDGAGFLSWGEDGTLRLWGAAGEERRLLSGHEDSVNGALLLPDDAGFLSWGEDGTLRLWGAAGEERAVLRGHESSVNGALLLPDDAGFLSWGGDGTVRIWEKSGQLRNLWLSPCGSVTHVEPYGKWDHYLIVFGGHVGIIHLAFSG